VAARLAGDLIDVLVVGGIYREQFLHRHPRSRVGGSGLVAAVAAASLGASTALAAAVGADDAEESGAILRKAGVDASAVEIMAGPSAGFVIGDEGEVQAPSVQFKDADSVPVLTHDPPRARIVLVFGMPDLDPFASGLVARWVDPQSTLIFDRQGWLSKTKDAAAACGVVARSRIYLANVGEAAQEVGGATPQQLLQHHPLPGFEYALLKNGRWGTTLLSSQERTAIPAFRVAAASTIGSGDVFAGALAAGLARSDDLRVAGTNAAAAAAVAISEVSPLLDSSAPVKIEAMVATGDSRYVDPAHLSVIAVAVEAAADAAVESAAVQLRTRLHDLGLGDGGTGSSATTIRVALRLDDGRIVADVSSRTGTSQTVELGTARDFGVLIDVIADRVEAARR
jgi:ribokinase